MKNKDLIKSCEIEIKNTKIAQKMWKSKIIPSRIESNKYIRFLRGVKKQLEILEIIKEFLLLYVDCEGHIITYIRPEDPLYEIIRGWRNGK